MSMIGTVIEAVGRLARRLLPDSAYRALRHARIRLFRSRIGLVSRSSRPRLWFERRVLRRRPTLFHFEIHVTDHCNLNCRGCTHFSNISPKWFADIDEFAREMRRMSELFGHVEQIYLMGGEPLLHPQIERFITVAREAFPRTRLYLMTNGLLVTRMPETFWAALAANSTVLLCDDYPIDLPKDEIALRAAEAGVTLEWTVPRLDFFRVPIDPAGGHDPVDAFHRCQGYNNCPIVRAGRLYPCAVIAYSDVLADRFDVQGLASKEGSSVDIFSVDDGWEVLDFMLRPVEWCSHCDFGSITFERWGRSTRAAGEWLGTGTMAADDGRVDEGQR